MSIATCRRRTLPRSRRPTAPARPPHGVLFVDSGGWLALFSLRDRRHDEAEALFQAALAARVSLLTTNLVVAEVHRLLLFRAGIAAAGRAVDVIDKSERVTLVFPSKEEHGAARQWLTDLDDQVITYTDAVSFAVMRSKSCSAVLGFDHDFEVAGFARWQGA